MKPITATPSGGDPAQAAPGGHTPEVGAPGGLARAALAAIRAYKILLSPVFAGSCRFTPSCADYAAEAIRQHGAGRGLLLALERLARCRPLGGWGVDPVPPRVLASPRPPVSGCAGGHLGQSRSGR